MIYMRLLILSFLITAHALAQDKTEQKRYSCDVGLDLTKLLPITQESGVMLESFVYGPIKKKIQVARHRRACRLEFWYDLLEP